VQGGQGLIERQALGRAIVHGTGLSTNCGHPAIVDEPLISNPRASLLFRPRQPLAAGHRLRVGLRQPLFVVVGPCAGRDATILGRLTSGGGRQLIHSCSRNEARSEPPPSTLRGSTA
jgi:hypothetical protein